MVDPNRKRIADLIRMLGSDNVGERRNAWTLLEHSMQTKGVSWTDIGDTFEGGGGDGKYTEAEMQELALASRAEGVEEGIKIGMVRAANGSGNANGHLTLPSPAEMAEFCQARQRMLKDDAQREFIDEMVVKTHNQMFPHNHRLKPGTLGYLVSLYIKHGGKT